MYSFGQSDGSTNASLQLQKIWRPTTAGIRPKQPMFSPPVDVTAAVGESLSVINTGSLSDSPLAGMQESFGGRR